MTFRLMTHAEITAWYETELKTTFVPQECKPLSDIFRLVEDGCYEIWGLFDEQLLLSYACLWKSPHVPLVLLDYLGVTAARRSERLGGKVLQLLKAQGRPLVTESEMEVADDTAQANALRRRRIAFYQRNGFTAAYIMATCGMAWQALIHAPQLTVEEIMAQHRALYGPDRTDVAVPLPPGAQPALPYWMK